jgi:PAS domain S-box-containing protein
VTQRGGAERRFEPRAAERLLAAIVDSSEDAILSTSLDGTIQTWNAGAERLFGYTADEAVGRGITLLVPAAGIEEEKTIEQRLQGGKGVEHLETVRIRSDGQPIHVSVTVSPLRDDSGAVVGSSQIVRDETERRAVHRALRESEERFRSMVKQVEDYAIFGADTEGRATTWNEGVQRVLGFGEKEFLGRDIMTLIFTPDDVSAGVPQRELEIAAATGTASNDRWMRRKDGAPFYAAGVTTALRDESGRLAGFTKVMRDWTARKRIEEALHRSETRYRRLFESATDGLLIIDAFDGRVISANPLLEELLAIPDGELVGMSLWEIGLFGDRAASESALLELREKGESRFDRVAIQRRGGERREVEIVANLYSEEERSVIQCNVRDVTERSRLERQTREQAAALAELDRRKDEFLAMLSHELRNPLAPIANAVQLLRLEGSETDVARQARSIIERQVAQLSRLVDDLLEVSRITSGSFQLRASEVALNDIVERAVESVGALAGQHELTLELPAPSPWVDGDPARLEQVVVNLLTNAIKYTADYGRISVMVDTGDGAAIVRVRDNGVGIAPDLLPRIFDLFTQAERSLDRAEGGLGIGLSLVRRLVELHGGTVEATSTLGEGSEFTMRLPTIPAPGSQARRDSESTIARRSNLLRVLVVDDNVDAATSLAMLLTAEGHEVRTAHEGRAGLRVAHELRPQAVFLDIGLPGLDGYEVARAIRRDEALGTPMLVAMTGYGQDADRLRSLAAGFDHHLVKPADFDQVRRILDVVHDRPPMR